MTQADIAAIANLEDFIKWGELQLNNADVYFGHGSDNAYSEIVFMVLAFFNIPMDTPAAELDHTLTIDEKNQLVDLVRLRIEKRIPAAYLLNKSFFAGLEFYVDQRVLIPRSPFAELVEQQFSPWVNPNKVKRILELCTGSGCIAIVSAIYFPDAIIDAVDISSDALAVAHINVEGFELGDRINLIESDLFENVPAAKYDLIISNPPYVSAEDLREVPAEFEFEPTLALEADDQGLALVIKIMQQAGDYLADGGVLAVEVGSDGPALLEQRFPNIAFTWPELYRGGEGIFLLNKEQL